MGSNHSKLCSGVPEREFRRALQDRVQQMYVTPQGRGTSPGTADTAVHIHCREDEVERYLDEIYADPVVFHFKVEKAPEVKPGSSVEGGEKPGAAGAAASVGAKAAEPGGNVTGESKLSGDVKVRSQPYRDIMVQTEAQASELELTLASEHFVEKSSRDSSERTKGCSAVEDLSPSSLESEHIVEKFSRVSFKRTKGYSAMEELSPSSLESVPSILSSGSQTRSTPIGAVESLNTGDVHHPNKDTSLTGDLKAPGGTDLELATGDTLGAAEEPTTGQMQIEEPSSEETLEEADECSSEDTIEEASDASSGGTLEEVGEAPSDLGPEEMADGCSDVKTDLETKEILPSLGKALPQAASEPLSIQKERKEVPEDYCDGGKADAQLEVLPKRAQREMLATVDSGGKKEQVIASKVFLMESHGRSVQTLRKKTVARRQDCLLLASAADVDGATKEEERQTSAVRNMEAQPSTNVAEMTGAAPSPKDLSEIAETGQGGPLFFSDESIAQVSRAEDNRPGVQLSPASVSVSDPTLEDGFPGQRC